MPDAVPGAFTTINQNISNVLTNEVFVVPSADMTRQPVSAKALWDTGAMCTVLSNELASELNLKPISIELISTPSGAMEARMFVVDLILPNDIEIKRVQALGAYPSSCDMLIGMDVIGLGDFAVTNYLHQTTFSFRIPSKQRIDFTKQHT
jgi:predicted aspartyl protease